MNSALIMLALFFGLAAGVSLVIIIRAIRAALNYTTKG